LNFTLRNALYARTVIEHPVLFVGSFENTAKLSMLVSTLSPSLSLGLLQEGCAEQPSSTGISPMITSVALSSPLKRKADSSVPTADSPALVKRTVASALTIGGGSDGQVAVANTAVDGDADASEEEIGDDESGMSVEDVFLQTLKEFENVPVERLLEIIQEDE
jgi:hypothetical protein